MKRNKTSLTARALVFLSKREYSQYELKKKLSRYLNESQNEDDIDRLIDDLKRNNWLSNERFADSLIRRRQTRRGNTQIIMELKQHQLADDLICEKLNAFQDNEYERAYAIWEKKFGHIDVEANSSFEDSLMNRQVSDNDYLSEEKDNFPADKKSKNLCQAHFANRAKALRSNWPTSENKLSSNKLLSRAKGNLSDKNSLNNQKQNDLYHAKLLMNKQMHFLASRGFSTETIRQVLKAAEKKNK